MQIGDFNASQSKNLTVEKPFSTLGFSLTTSATVDNVSKLITELKKVSISVSYVKRDGNPIRPITSINLYDLAMMSQNKSGAVSFDTVNRVCRFTIDLSESGNIPFNNDETCYVDIVNGSADITGKVFAIEVAFGGVDYVAYSTLDVLAGKKDVSFDVTYLSALMLNRSDVTASTEIQITYTNGRVCRYKIDELLFIESARDNNLIVSIDSNNMATSRVSQSPDVIALDIETAKEIRITRDSTSAFSFLALSRMALPDVGTFVDDVQGLVNPVEAVLERKINHTLNRY
jgi:hypothetical protein